MCSHSPPQRYVGGGSETFPISRWNYHLTESPGMHRCALLTISQNYLRRKEKKGRKGRDPTGGAATPQCLDIPKLTDNAKMAVCLMPLGEISGHPNLKLRRNMAPRDAATGKHLFWKHNANVDPRPRG